MRSISDTIERLSKLRAVKGQPFSGEDRLVDLGPFGSNPGALDAKLHLPKDLGRPAPLVVVLHGCTQTAAAYDFGSGWSRLADDYGFAVLFPQQSRSNNANTCFNWFLPSDIKRDQGEALSIRQMIQTVVSRHDIDPTRIFITGLSAGGAMANVMLATYPELFAGGAIIAGLPYGTATTVPEAFDRMRGHGLSAAASLQTVLRAASAHVGPWPTISVWQGTKDHTVAPANALAIAEQWRGVHAAHHAPEIASVDGHRRMVWTDLNGREAIELFQVGGMGHGTPIDASSGYGKACPYMLDIGLSSTQHIARSWGLIASFEKRPTSDVNDQDQPSAHAYPSSVVPNYGGGIQQTIDNALRAAGLKK